eukprot:jgi/Botrbrau1/5502/Bobra.27_1s0039.1
MVLGTIHTTTSLMTYELILTCCIQIVLSKYTSLLSPSPDSPDQLLAQTLKPTARTSQSFGFLDSQL